MKTEIVATDNFQKKAKKFLRKYKSLKAALNLFREKRFNILFQK